MYIFDELRKEAIKHAAAYRELCEKISQKIDSELDDITLDAQSTLFSNGFEKGKIYRILEGLITLSVNEVDIIIFEEGDIVGEWLVDAEGIVLRTDFAVRVDQFSNAVLETKLCSDFDLVSLWFSALADYTKFITYCYAQVSKDDKQATPEVLKYKRGDVIITEGEKSDSVFTLLNGEAVASVNGIEVGKIFEDEIFGALGPLTDRPRTATVTASKSCSVLSLPKDNFEQLISSRPHTVFKLIEDMASKIEALNDKLVSISS